MIQTQDFNFKTNRRRYRPLLALERLAVLPILVLCACSQSNLTKGLPDAKPIAPTTSSTASVNTAIDTSLRRDVVDFIKKAQDGDAQGAFAEFTNAHQMTLSDIEQNQAYRDAPLTFLKYEPNQTKGRHSYPYIELEQGTKDVTKEGKLFWQLSFLESVTENSSALTLPSEACWSPQALLDQLDPQHQLNTDHGEYRSFVNHEMGVPIGRGRVGWLFHLPLNDQLDIRFMASTSGEVFGQFYDAESEAMSTWWGRLTNRSRSSRALAFKTACVDSVRIDNMKELK